jgi:hypothetical protein
LGDSGGPAGEVGWAPADVAEADGFVRGQAGGHPAQLVGLFQQRPDAWEQGLARRGKRHGAAVPVEQACTEDAFQGLDLLRQRWSGNAQPRGGPAEVEFLGYGHEVAQLPELHKLIVAPWEVPPTSRENAGRGGAGGCGA